MNTAQVIELRPQPKQKKSRGYDYLNLKTFTKSQVNGLTKAIMSQRWGTYDRGKMWDNIFDKAKSYGLDAGYSGAYYGERLDFTTPRKITKEQTDFGKRW